MMKQYCGIGILLLLFSCGKKFQNPDGNHLLSAVITASPLTVAADSLVTINGQGFRPDPAQDQVFFNGVAAAVLQASPVRLVVKVPAQGSTGPITARVGGEQANGPVFTYAASSVFSISPSSGMGGTTVTLTGNKVGLVATTTVSFGNLPGKVLYTDSTRIIVAAPDSVKTGPLTIKTNGNQYAGPVFTLCTITSISPSVQGAGAGTLMIVGTGFNPVAGKNTVNFPTNPSTRVLSADSVVVAPVIQGNADTLIVNVPATAGTGAISVNPNGQNVITGPVFTLFAIRSVNALSFPFVCSSGFPQLLTGNGFNPNISQNHLTVNGLNCTISSISPKGDSIIFYPPDLVGPSKAGTANGPIVLQSGALTTTFTQIYSRYTNPTILPVAYIYQEVSTLAGGGFGLANGRGRQAQFETLSGITTDGSSRIFVTDKQANNVRAITMQGDVTLVAGSPTGQAGYQDGIGAAVLFNAPSGVIYDGNGNLYVADSGNFRIRKINLSTYQVTTVSGSGVQGSVDGRGAAAQYLGPNNISLGGYVYQGGYIPFFYIMDVSGGKGNVRRLSGDGSGTITTVRSGLINPETVSAVTYNYTNFPLFYCSNQAFYIPAAGGLIAGVPGTTGFQNAQDGTTALFNNPAGIIYSSVPIPNGVYPHASTQSFLISDRDNNVIRAVDLTNYPNKPYPVSTYIGGTGSTTAGYRDGGYRTALFNQPGPITAIFGSPGSTGTNYYLCDVGNHAIRVFN